MLRLHNVCLVKVEPSLPSTHILLQLRAVRLLVGMRYAITCGIF
jgi:hypothetical protein